LDNSSEIFRKKIRKLTATRGAGSDLAKRAGVSRQYISQLASEDNLQSITLETLDKIAKALGTNPSSLIEEDHPQVTTQQALEIVADALGFEGLRKKETPS
jgi:transcriptional regulator with XRE-family HTH domain